MSGSVETRVTDLERIVRDMVYAQMRAAMAVEQLTNDMSDFKGEMSDFKKEMSDFKTEVREDRREMNRRWGELANKMGTIVEDVVAPSIHGAMRTHFSVNEPEIFMVRVRKRHPKEQGRTREFDVIAASPGLLFLDETKSTVRQGYLEDFLANKEEVFEYFPEYKGRKLVPIFSSLYIPPEMVRWLTERDCYAMMMGEEAMDIVNFSEISGKSK